MGTHVCVHACMHMNVCMCVHTHSYKVKLWLPQPQDVHNAYAWLLCITAYVLVKYVNKQIPF